MTKIQAFRALVDDFFARNGERAKQAFEEIGGPFCEQEYLDRFRDENPFVVSVVYHMLTNIWFSGEHDGFDN